MSEGDETAVTGESDSATGRDESEAAAGRGEADGTTPGDTESGETRTPGTPPDEAAAVSIATAKSSLLWGVVGGLSFLVLVQGYELLTDQGVALKVKAGMALGVAVAASVATYLVQDRLAKRYRRH